MEGSHMTNDELSQVVLGIIRRGNTAEVKKTKDGILILEVKKSIAAK